MSEKINLLDRAEDYYRNVASMKCSFIAYAKALLELKLIPTSIGNSIITRVNREEILSLTEARDVDRILHEYENYIDDWEKFWRIFNKYYPANIKKLDERDKYIYEYGLPEYAKNEIQKEREELIKWIKAREQIERERSVRKRKEESLSRIDREIVNNSVMSKNDTKARYRDKSKNQVNYALVKVLRIEIIISIIGGLITTCSIHSWQIGFSIYRFKRYIWNGSGWLSFIGELLCLCLFYAVVASVIHIAFIFLKNKMVLQYVINRRIVIAGDIFGIISGVLIVYSLNDWDFYYNWSFGHWFSVFLAMAGMSLAVTIVFLFVHIVIGIIRNNFEFSRERNIKNNVKTVNVFPPEKTPVEVNGLTMEQQLIQLKQLQEEGLITQEDYDAKKKKILGI